MFGFLFVLLLGGAVVLLVVVSELSARLRQVETRLRALEADAASRVPAPALGGAAAPPPPAPATPPTPPTPEIRHYVPPRRPAAPAPGEPAPVAAATPPVRWGQLEARVGIAWLSRMGVVLLLLGIGFFLKYAFDNDWIGPTGRVTLGLVAGVVFLALGERLQRAAYRVPAHAVVALGIGTLYLSVYAAYGFYQLVPQLVAFALMILVTATGLAVALHHDARVIAVLANVGGFLTPALLSTGTDQAGALFTYLAILDAGMIVTSARRTWRELPVLSFALTQAYFWAWHRAWYGPERLGVAIAGATAFFLIFALVAVAEATASRAPRGWRAAPVLVFAPPTAYFLAMRAILYPEHRTWLGLLCLVLATGYFAAGRWAAAAPRAWAALALSHVAIALAFLTLTFPVQFTEHTVAIGWSAQGLALLWGGFRLGAPKLRGVALLVLLLAGLRWVTLIGPRARYDGLLALEHPAFGATLAFVVACGLAAALYAAHQRAVTPRETPAGPLLALAAIGAAATFLADAVREHTLLARLPRHLGVLTTVIWTAAAVPVLVLAPRDRTRITAHAAWLLLVGLGVAALTDAAAPPPGPAVVNLRFGSALLIVLVYGVFATMIGDLPIGTAETRDRLRGLAAGSAAVFLLWNLTTEVALMPLPGLRLGEADKVRSLGFSVLWTVYAFVALGIGIWRNLPPLRFGAIALFGVTIAKVLLFDLSGLDAAYRILSFLVLGALLLVASFLYTRYRHPA